MFLVAVAFFSGIPGFLRLFFIRGPGGEGGAGRFHRTPLTAIAGVGLALVTVLFSGSMTPASGQEPVPVYGSGPVQIRVYTDYLCAPCRALEAEMEPLLAKIVSGGKARVIYLDTPMHRETIIFVKQFLCATRGASHHETVRVRRVLFAAAAAGILTEEGLKDYLNRAGVRTGACDTSAVMLAMNGYFRDDAVKSTPTCVIITSEGKKSFSGRDPIVAALKPYAR